MSPDGYFIAAGSADKSVYLLRRDSDTPEQNYKTTNSLGLGGGTINSVCISKRIGSMEYYGAAACADKNLYFFKRTNANWVATATLDAAVTKVACNENATIFAAGTDSDGGLANPTSRIYLYTRSGDTVTRSWRCNVSVDPGTNPKVNAVAMAGDYIVAGMQHKKAYQFVAGTSAVQHQMTFADAVSSLDVVPNGHLAVGAGQYVYAVDLVTKISGSIKIGGTVNSVSISDDGAYVAAAGADKKVYLFRFVAVDASVTLENVWSYTAPDSVLSVAISSDGSHVIAGDNSGNVCFFYRGGTGTPIWTTNYGSAMGSAVLDEKGNYAAAGGADKKVHLFSPSFAISVSSSPESSAKNPGQTQVYRIIVTNNGNRYDTFTILQSGTNYAWGTIEKQSVSAAPGQAATFNYTVRVPSEYSDAYAGAKSTVDLLAKSTRAESLSTVAQVSKKIITTVNQVYGVSLSPDSQQKSIVRGGSASFMITVLNTGNGQDAISLLAEQIELSGWGVAINPASVSKNGSRSDNYQSATVTITAPLEAKNGDRATFRITGKAMNGAGGQSAQATANVVAVVSPQYGFTFNIDAGEQTTKKVTAGGQTSFVFVVSNTGNAVDTFKMETSRGGFDYAEFELNPGEQKEVTLTAATSSTENGTYPVSVTAKSTAGNQQKSMNLFLNVEAPAPTNPTPGFELAFLTAALLLAFALRRR
jgi:WD40 repeat protein